MIHFDRIIIFLILFLRHRANSFNSGESIALYFLHMRKCGGTSVGSFIRKWIHEKGCCPSHAPCRPAPFWMRSADDANNWFCRGSPNSTIHFREDEYTCLTGYFDIIVAGPLEPKIVSITILRHPIDRIISQWWYHGGPGHKSLQLAVAERCATNSTPGMLERLKSKSCYSEAVREVQMRSRKDVTWWTHWLDSNKDRIHLFRSLHSNYIDNYFVRRLVAETSNSVPISTAQLFSSHSAAAVAKLDSLRRRCNIRGMRPLTDQDQSSAERALKAFRAVLITEWLSGPSADMRGSAAYGMLAMLKNILGSGSPSNLAHFRQGISQTTSKDPGDSWGLVGRGENWRLSQVPFEVLRRLETENSMDMNLYIFAASLAKSRVKEVLAQVLGN